MKSVNQLGKLILGLLITTTINLDAIESDLPGKGKEDCFYYVSQKKNTVPLKQCLNPETIDQIKEGFKCNARTKLALFDKTIDSSGAESYKNKLQVTQWPKIKGYLYITYPKTSAVVAILGTADINGEIVFKNTPCKSYYEKQGLRSEFKYNMPNMPDYIPGWERVRTNNDSSSRDQYTNFYLKGKSYSTPQTYADITETYMTLGSFSFPAEKISLQISTPLDTACKPLDKQNLKEYFHSTEISNIEDIYRKLKITESQIGEFKYSNQGVFDGLRWNEANVTSRLAMASQIEKVQANHLKFNITNSARKSTGYEFGFMNQSTKSENISLSWNVNDMKEGTDKKNAKQETQKLSLCLFRNIAKVDFKTSSGNSLFLGNRPDMNTVFKADASMGVIPEFTSDKSALKLFLPYQQNTTESIVYDIQSNPNYSGTSDAVQVFNGKIQISYTGQGVKIYPSGSEAQYKPVFNLAFAKGASFTEPVSASLDICLFDDEDLRSGAISNPTQVQCKQPLDYDFKFSGSGLKLEKAGSFYKVTASADFLNKNGREFQTTLEPKRSDSVVYGTGLKVYVINDVANGNTTELFFEHSTTNAMVWKPDLPKFKNRIYVRSSDVVLSYEFKTNLGDYDKYLFNFGAMNAVKFEAMNPEGTVVNQRIQCKIAATPNPNVHTVTLSGGTQTELRNALRYLRVTANLSKSWLGVYYKDFQSRAFVDVNNRLMFVDESGKETPEIIEFSRQPVDIAKKKILLKIAVDKILPMPPTQGNLEIKYIPDSGFNSTWKQKVPARDAVAFSQEDWIKEDIEVAFKDYKDDQSFMVLPAFELKSVLKYSGYEPEIYYLNANLKSGKAYSIFTDMQKKLLPDTSKSQELLSYLRKIAEGEEPPAHTLQINLISENIEPRTPRACSANLFKDITDPTGCISVHFGGKQTRFCALRDDGTQSSVNFNHWRNLSADTTCTLAAAASDSNITEMHIGFHGEGGFFNEGRNDTTVSIWRINGKPVSQLWRDEMQAESIMNKFKGQINRQKASATIPYDNAFGTNKMRKIFADKCEAKGLCTDIFNDEFMPEKGGPANRLNALHKLGFKNAKLKDAFKLEHILVTQGNKNFSDQTSELDYVATDEHVIILKLNTGAAKESEAKKMFASFLPSQMSLVSPIDGVEGIFTNDKDNKNDKDVYLSIKFPTEKREQVYATAFDVILFNRTASLKTLLKLKVENEAVKGEGEKITLSYSHSKSSGDNLIIAASSADNGLLRFEVEPRPNDTSTEDSLKIELVDHLNNVIPFSELKPGGKYAGLSIESAGCIDLSKLNAVFNKKYTAEIVRDSDAYRIYFADKNGDYAKLTTITRYNVNNVALSTGACRKDSKDPLYTVEIGEKFSIVRGPTENSYVVQFTNKLKSNQIIVKKENLLNVYVLQKDQGGGSTESIKGLDLALLVDGISTPLKFTEGKRVVQAVPAIGDKPPVKGSEAVPAHYYADLSSLNLKGKHSFQIITKSNIVGNAELGTSGSQNNVLYNSIEADEDTQLTELDFDGKSVTSELTIYLPEARFSENEILIPLDNAAALKNVSNDCFNIKNLKNKKNVEISGIEFSDRLPNGVIAKIALGQNDLKYPNELELSVDFNEKSCGKYTFATKSEAEITNSENQSNTSENNAAKSITIEKADSYTPEKINAVVSRSFKSGKNSTFISKLNGQPVDYFPITYKPVFFTVKMTAIPDTDLQLENENNKAAAGVSEAESKIILVLLGNIEKQFFSGTFACDMPSKCSFYYQGRIKDGEPKFEFVALLRKAQGKLWRSKFSGASNDTDLLPYKYDFKEIQPWVADASQYTHKKPFFAELRLIKRSFFEYLDIEVKEKIETPNLFTFKYASNEIELKERDVKLTTDNREQINLIIQKFGKSKLFFERINLNPYANDTLSDRLYWAEIENDITNAEIEKLKCVPKDSKKICQTNQGTVNKSLIVLRENGKDCFTFTDDNGKEIKDIHDAALARVAVQITNAGYSNCQNNAIYSALDISKPYQVVKWESDMSQADHKAHTDFLELRSNTINNGNSVAYISQATIRDWKKYFNGELPATKTTNEREEAIKKWKSESQKYISAVQNAVKEMSSSALTYFQSLEKEADMWTNPNISPNIHNTSWAKSTEGSKTYKEISALYKYTLINSAIPESKRNLSQLEILTKEIVEVTTANVTSIELKINGGHLMNISEGPVRPTGLDDEMKSIIAEYKRIVALLDDDRFKITLQEESSIKKVVNAVHVGGLNNTGLTAYAGIIKNSNRSEIIVKPPRMKFKATLRNEVPPSWLMRIHKAEYTKGDYNMDNDSIDTLLKTIFDFRYPEKYLTSGTYVNTWPVPYENLPIGSTYVQLNGNNLRLIDSTDKSKGAYRVEIRKFLEQKENLGENWESFNPLEQKLEVVVKYKDSIGRAQIVKDEATEAWILADGGLPPLAVSEGKENSKVEEKKNINVIYLMNGKVVDQTYATVSIDSFQKFLGSTGNDVKDLGGYSQFGSDCTGPEKETCLRNSMAGKLVGLFDMQKLEGKLGSSDTTKIGNTTGRVSGANLLSRRKEYLTWFKTYASSGSELKKLEGAAYLSRQLCYVTSNWLLGQLEKADKKMTLEEYIMERLVNGDLGMGCTGGAPCVGHYTVSWADAPIDYRTCSEREGEFCYKPVNTTIGREPKMAESGSRWQQIAPQRKVMHGRISYNNPNKVTDDHSLIIIKDSAGNWNLWDHTGTQTRGPIVDWERKSPKNGFFWGIGADPAKKKP